MVADYMTFEEARDHLRIALSAVYAAADRGDLERAEVLGKTVLTRESVMAYRPRPNSRRGGGAGEKATK
jgi:hypothetical protein